jgi:hypothetical protein
MELKKIEQEIAKLNKNLDGITDSLVAVLSKYQTEYERLLFRADFDLKSGNLKPTIANYNKAQSLSPMQKLGFNDLAIKYIKKYTDIAKAQIAWNKRIGIDTDFDFRDVTILKQLQDIDFGVFQAEANLLDQRIKKELVNAIALQMPYQKTVDQLSASLLGGDDTTGRLAGFANTYMRSALFSLSKAIDQEIYERRGVNEFYYLGPVDAVTREFCLRRIGKKFTTKEIENFGDANGSGLNGFLLPGGFNCRHRMIPADQVE